MGALSNLQNQGERQGVGRSAIAAVIILLLIGVAFGIYFTAGSSKSSTTSTSSSSTSSTSTSGTGTAPTSGSSTGGFVITNMYADIIGAGLQAPYENSSSVPDRSTFTGTPGQQFQVVFDVVYQLCAAGSCPTAVTAVVVQTHGFSVIPPTVPPMPVSCNATVSVNVECTFTVTVQAPSSPYTGTLTLVAQA